MQILSVAFAEQRPQFFASLLISFVALAFATWFIVPISNPASGVWALKYSLLPGIWILTMSHLQFTERINRPLKFAVSLPAPRWQWWLSRTAVCILINAFVAGLVILAAVAWIRIAEDPGNADSILKDSIYVTLLTTCAMASAFLAWSITGIGFLWPAVLVVLVSVLSSGSQNFILDFKFWPHVAVALPLGLLLSYWGFLHRLKAKSSRLPKTKDRRTIRRFLPWAIRAGVLAAVVGGMAILASLNKEQSSVIRTEHLEFSSSKEDVGLIQPLVDSADDTFQTVKRVFDPVDPPSRYRVVITEAFDQTGIAGKAHWNLVRLGRDALAMDDIYPTQEILQHELAHVFLETLSDGKLGRHFQAMQILHEGVATYCESLPDRETLTPIQTWRILGTLTDEEWRKPIPFSDILNGKGDRYGHGLMFAEALAEEFGEDSFHAIAAEVADLESRTIFYHGEAFWYLLCNRLGYSVELLESRYLKVKSDYQERYADVLSLPRPGFRFIWKDDEVILRSNKDPQDVAKLVFYSNSGKDSLIREFGDPLTEDDEGNIRLSFDYLKSLPRTESGTISYRPGWKIESLPLPLYAPAAVFPWNHRLEDNHENFVLDAKVIRSSSDHDKKRDGAKAVDGSPFTYWHTRRDDPESVKHPHELVIDLGKSTGIKAFHYLARQDSSWDGSFNECEFLVSENSEDFQSIAASARFKKTKVLQPVKCGPSVTGRYVLVRVLSEINGRPWASAAEIIVERSGDSRTE